MNIIIKRSLYSESCAEIDIDNISRVHWDSLSGGYKCRQSGTSIYGNIDYGLGTELGLCSGQHAFYNSDIKIVIPCNLNKDSKEHRMAYNTLKDEAGIKPIQPRKRKENAPPCTKFILSLLKEHAWYRGDLRNAVKNAEYNVIFSDVIKRLLKQDKIKVSGSPNSSKQIISINS